LIVSLALAGAALFFLLRESTGRGRAEDNKDDSGSDQTVRVDSEGRIVVKAGTPLDDKLSRRNITIEREKLSMPLLVVTGSAVARRGPGATPAESRWDFNSPETANAHADWLKAGTDLAFNEKQLDTIRRLNKTQLETQTEVVERLKKLVKAGTDPEKDLVKEQAELRKMTLQAQKDEHEAETAVRNAQRTLRTLERMLFQAGASPDLLSRAALGTTLVVAEVPEGRVGLVEEGQACKARFFSYPGKDFDGRVGNIAPVLSKERRTMRVFFELEDPNGRLKPGMFAEVRIGTNPRPILLAPSDAILHVGEADYTLVAEGEGKWQVRKVKVGEAYRNKVEILSGLEPKEQILGEGAILLKPLVIRSLGGTDSPEGRPQ
jgi:multidrug efflux pump subunit AcrA (membrane-fusion protein)